MARSLGVLFAYSIVAIVFALAGCSEVSGSEPSTSHPDAGTQSCAADLQLCGSQCVDLLSHGSHCGACDLPCPDGLVCSAGQCATSCTIPGQAACGSSCANLQSDPLNCGVCGAACAGGQTCQGGKCGCAMGLSLCSGQCTDTKSSVQHCGGCGIACAAGQLCTGGICSPATGMGGAVGTGGVAGVGGNPAGGTSGASTGGATGVGGNPTGGSTGTGGAASCTQEEQRFSFFMTSLAALQTLSGNSDGYGGDLGGLAGADALCQIIAESSTPCAARQQWRAFLSTTAGPVHARDRIGQGPWYDRAGRVVAMTLADMLSERPVGADPTIINDFPNEFGVPNHDPDGTGDVDNHNVLTGSDMDGMLYSQDASATCQDWSSSVASGGRPRCGVSWPRAQLTHWISALNEGGCAPGATPPGQNSGESGTVGALGGYGAFYCFAVTP